MHSYNNSTGSRGTKAAYAGLGGSMLILLAAVTIVGSANQAAYADESGKGTEGCTPGFWKNHPEDWPAGVTPDTKMSAIFNGGSFTTIITIKVNNQQVTDPTIMQALNAQGGGVNALARHAAAAYLNAITSNDDIDYQFNANEVINRYRWALDGTSNPETIKNIFEAENEKGCPL